MDKIAVFYGSTTGTTKEIAVKISAALGQADVFEITPSDAEKFSEYDLIVAGTSTWGMGDIQDSWEDVLTDISKKNLSGKKVALFGTGDQSSYESTFVDGLGILKEAFEKTGASLIGEWPSDGYSFTASRGHDGNAFAGLVIDEDNQPEKSDERISTWVASIKEA